MIPMDAEDISPFHLVAQTFAKIGLLTFDQFLQAPADINDCGGSYHYCDRTPTPPPALGDKVDSNVTGLAVADDNKVACITRLHQACQRAFGRTDVLKYEFIEVHGPNTKQCILTITRPGPSTSSSTNTRSYTTPTTYHRKSEAKAHTSALAISLGALEFISTGFTKADSASSQPGLVLEPLKAHDDAPPDGVERKDGEDDGKVDEGVRRIENCWAEWRGGLKSRPGWVEYDGKPHDSGYGVALRIELSPHSLRVYSTDAIYATSHEAKSACAAQAIEQGVLEFIKFGNGQTHPPARLPPSSTGPSNSNTSTNTKPAPITLQNYYESLPRPFPENFPSAAAPTDINAPSWLNTTLQTARGAKLSAQFIWLMSPKGSATIMHGCLLRILRPSHPPLSYLLLPLFQKRADAKNAVCLQAISQGIGEYIRGVVRELDEKVTAEMRRVAGEFYAGLGEGKRLGAGCGGAREGWARWVRWEFEKDKDAFGCTLTLELPNSKMKKSWSVPTEYRTKADAKVAVAYAASEGGAMEFLKFRGKEPPAGYRSWHSTVMSGDAITSSSSGIGGKRRERDTDSSGLPDKKARLSTPMLETKEEAMKRMRAEREDASVQVRNPGRRDMTNTYTNDIGLSYGNPGNGTGLELPGHSVHSRAISGHPPSAPQPQSWSYPPTLPAGCTPGPYYPPPPPGAASYWDTQQYYPGPPPPAPAHVPIHSYGNYVQHPPQSQPQPQPATRYHHPIAQPPPLPPPLYARGPSYGLTPPLHNYVGQTSLSAAHKPPPRPLPQRLNISPTESHSSWQKSSRPVGPKKSVQDLSMSTPPFPKSHFISLTEYCARNQITPPQWHNSESGKGRYKVWCIMGSERMELAVDFVSVDEGKERISKQVLNRLRSKEKAGKP